MPTSIHTYNHVNPYIQKPPIQKYISFISILTKKEIPSCIYVEINILGCLHTYMDAMPYIHKKVCTQQSFFHYFQKQRHTQMHTYIDKGF